MTPHPPYRIILELTEGCDMACDYCGIHSIRRPLDVTMHHMRQDTLRGVLSEMRGLRWTSNIWLSGRGDPSHHPDLFQMIESARELQPNRTIVLETSMTGFYPNWRGRWANLIPALYDAGMNVLLMTIHDHDTRIARVLEWLHPLTVLTGHELNEKRESGSHYEKTGTRWASHDRVVILQDPPRGPDRHTEGGVSAPHTGTGSRMRCYRPMLDLAIRHDGSVALCTHDWRGVYKIGSIHEMSLEQIWNSDRMAAARSLLTEGHREDLLPCRLCSRMEEPKRRLRFPVERVDQMVARALVREAVGGLPLTPPVLRPWER